MPGVHFRDQEFGPFGTPHALGRVPRHGAGVKRLVVIEGSHHRVTVAEVDDVDRPLSEFAGLLWRRVATRVGGEDSRHEAEQLLGEQLPPLQTGGIVRFGVVRCIVERPVDVEPMPHDRFGREVVVRIGCPQDRPARSAHDRCPQLSSHGRRVPTLGRDSRSRRRGIGVERGHEPAWQPDGVVVEKPQHSLQVGRGVEIVGRLRLAAHRVRQTAA